jgi:hypothetical protein
LATEFEYYFSVLFVAYLLVFCHIYFMADKQPKKKTELYGQNMELLGEDLEKSNAALGVDAKNDQLGIEAIEAMQSLLKSDQSDPN